MNAIDIAIVVILIAGGFRGLRQGLILEIAGIAAVIAGLVVAKAEYARVQHAIIPHIPFVPKGPWRTVIAYLLVFVIVYALIGSLGQLVRRVSHLSLLGPLDRLAGGILGLFQAAVVIELLLYLAKRVPHHELHRLIAHSSLAPTFLKVVPYVDRWFPHVPLK